MVVVNGDARILSTRRIVAAGDKITGCTDDETCVVAGIVRQTQTITCSCGVAYHMSSSGTMTRKGGGEAKSAFK
ncbi:MAG: hypothetical protein COU33_04000 [Candidatus Magasanikbacteria bacterium CG10_big_fil_rev_8_21_14_0_10_43_6]|uniref:Uncharacterized protein n=1 Tax=Candidatus Magasanikbacteria bacterium CG10_big_fil_rev_8_21_14_0_10_43_6 TaxID=1974650 RepID=A0A2M6W0E1_9BACT|nr:MAG: hypothetical protein COU33_04000 [Candidatus Magasanikbacteria bacterium CG10_big_fil_rev_8_21_14_0_10_43_6]